MSHVSRAAALSMSPPSRVLLFSGHRVDVPGRVPARFPADKVAAAAVAIDTAIDALAIGPADLALTQGSSGGDLLFAEACVRRGARLRLMLPAPETAFIGESVRASVDGEYWVRRYLAVRAKAERVPDVLPESLADATSASDRFERCNQWLLETALLAGPECFRFMCLWDGGPSGGPGGTAHLVDEVRGRGLPIVWLDARLL